MPESIADIAGYLLEEESLDSNFVLLETSPFGVSIKTTLDTEEMCFVVDTFQRILNGKYEEADIRH